MQLASKTVPEDLNLKFGSKFNLEFTIHDCLHCAILKALSDFYETRVYEARYSQVLFQNFQSEVFKIFKMFQNNNLPKHSAESTQKLATEITALHS